MEVFHSKRFEIIRIDGKMTAKEAMQRMLERYMQTTEKDPKKKLVGLDINDYLSVFLDSTDVILMEYTMPDGCTLKSTLIEHKEEILDYVKGVKSVMLQVICGSDFELMMDDMNGFAAFVDLLDCNVNFYWGIDSEDSTEFKVKIEAYVVK